MAQHDVGDTRLARALLELDVTLTQIERMTQLGRLAVEQDEFLPLAAEQLGIRLGHDVAALPDGWKAQRPEVPWRSITGLRNRLAHNYHEIDFSILWSVFEQNAPALQAALAGDVEWARNVLDDRGD